MSLSQFSSELDDFFHMSSQLPFPTGFRSISRNSICIIMLLLQKRTQSIKILVVVYRSCLSLWAMTTLLSLSLCSFKGNNSIGNLRTLNHSSIDQSMPSDRLIHSSKEQHLGCTPGGSPQKVPHLGAAPRFSPPEFQNLGFAPALHTWGFASPGAAPRCGTQV